MSAAPSLPAAVTIPSRSEPGVEHRVWPEAGAWRCTCQGFYYRGHCRHVMSMPALPMAAPVEEPSMSITNLQRAPAPTALEVVQPRSPVLPDADTWRTMVNMAQVLKASNLLGRHISSPEAAVAIILKGYEIGVPPMQALTDIYLIDGRLTCSANLMTALIYSRMGGNALRVTESTPARCVVEYRRPDWPAASWLEWTLDMAERAGLAGRDNWKKYPEAMLRARCIAAVARLGFNDVVMGMYLPEEMGARVAVTPEGEVEVEPGAIEATVAAPAQPAPISQPTTTAPALSGRPEPETRRPVPKAPPPDFTMTEFWRDLRADGYSTEDVQAAAMNTYGRPVQQLDPDQKAALREAGSAARIQPDAVGNWRIVPVGEPTAAEPAAEGAGEPEDGAAF